MKQRLLIWDQNWADEFDIFGFELVDDIAVKTVMRILKRTDDEDPVAGKYYFGTNKALDLCSEEILNVLKNARELSKEECAVIRKYLGSRNGRTFFNSICSRILDFDVKEDRILTLEENELLENYIW